MFINECKESLIQGLQTTGLNGINKSNLHGLKPTCDCISCINQDVQLGMVFFIFRSIIFKIWSLIYTAYKAKQPWKMYWWYKVRHLVYLQSITQINTHELYTLVLSTFHDIKGWKTLIHSRSSWFSITPIYRKNLCRLLSNPDLCYQIGVCQICIEVVHVLAYSNRVTSKKINWYKTWIALAIFV